MKIAVWHNLPSGGGKRALFDQVKELTARGHHVEAWAPPTIDDEFLPLSNLIDQHIVALQRDDKPRNLDRLQLTLATERAIQNMDRHCAECAEQISHGGFDLLFANACQTFRSTSIGRYTKLPSVLYLGEPYRWLYEAMPEPPWAAPPPIDKITLSALKKKFIDVRNHRNARVQIREEVQNARAFNLVLCNSMYSRESILRAYGVEAEVCYLGIADDVSAEVRTTEESNLKDKPFVIGLGAFTREKNVALCIRAISMVRPKVSLVWIGNLIDELYYPSLIRLAQDLEVDFVPKIKVSEDDLAKYMRAAFVMIYAPRLEPFGLAAIEAGRYALPVVAVAEGGVRETIFDKQNGLLVEGSASALAAGITSLQDDPPFAKKLGDYGQVLVRTMWSNRIAIDRLEQKLVKAVNEGLGSPRSSCDMERSDPK